MYRKIIKPKGKKYVIEIPKEYINKEVELLVIPVSETKDKEENIKKNDKIKDFFLKELLNGPTMSEDEIATWEENILNGYTNWKIEEF